MMSLYKRIFIGVLFISFCLIGLIFINTQLILVDSYEHLEQQNAAQNIGRVVRVLQNDIDNIHISDPDLFAAAPSMRATPITSNRAFVQDSLLKQINLDANLNVAVLLDDQNKIVSQNIVSSGRSKSVLIPKGLVSSLRPGSPLVDGLDVTSEIRGILALPEGLLMTVSVPFPLVEESDSRIGRLVAGRFIDDDEIQHLTDSSTLDVKVIPYNAEGIPVDFVRAKTKLDAANHVYVEPVNDQLVSSYTAMDDIYGRPALMLRAQMPRFISHYGQDTISSFFVSMLLVIILLATVAFLLLERTILSRLNILNRGLLRAKAANDLTLEVFTTGSDEITTLSNYVKEIFKSHAQTKTQLQDIQDKLEKRVVERTVELNKSKIRLEQELADRKQANATLTQARDKALAELHFKSQLLANVTHDSRTPLTIIGLNTEMLQQGRHGELNDKQNEVLNRILIATRQLMNFITNMLDEAQLKNGKMPFVNVTFEPRLLLEEFTSMLAPLAETKGIELKADLDLALPSQLKGDPERLKQVLSNLCENAIKYTDKGSVTIKAVRTDSLHWSISVIDTGHGIPSEAQSRIFEAYWQLNSTLKRDSNRGVGLGLSIVKQIVQLMKGTISVKSKVGEGTTFEVILPIEEFEARKPVLQLTM